MSEDVWSDVDRYFAEMFIPADPVLDAALQTDARSALPEHDVSPSQGKMLWLLAKMMGARRILEIGTLAGYSTIWLARALPADGRLITLEVNERHAQVAQRNLANAGLADIVSVRVGSALETLPQLVAEGQEPFDLIFIDADKLNNTEYFQWSLQLSRPGTLMIADNVVRDGAVVDGTSDDPSVIGVRRFCEAVANEPRVSATAIQTVGSKGYDGFALLLVGDA